MAREFKPGVLVLMGGPDAEREVSLASGAAVAEALRASERFRVVERVVERTTPEEIGEIASREAIGVVFPALHGPWGEGGPLQEILDAAGLAYVGAGRDAAALAMDKLATKLRLGSAGIPTPPARLLAPGEECTIEPPLVLKPNDDGSSVDIRICRDTNEVTEARRLLQPRRGSLLAEAFVDGREVTIGVLCGDPLPPIEIVPSVEFYDYDAKYDRDDMRYDLLPDFPEGTLRACRDRALEAYRLLGCRDIARVDFMVDDRDAWFLELNTMPGFTSHSLVPMAATKRGLDMPALCTRLVLTALDRGPMPARDLTAPAAAGRKRLGG